MNKDHCSVLLHECLSGLNIKDNGIYLDCTFGAGGHSRAILDANKTVKLIAIDRDMNNKIYADNLKQDFGDRFVFENALFSEIDQVAEKLGIKYFDGILYDIGVSSMQLDQAERGFSFQHEGKLDMRMGLGKISAYEIVNKYRESDLAGLIYNNGDEHQSRKIASYIVKYRAKKNIETTRELADIVIDAVGMRFAKKIHPATKTFQAIRIAVNDELNQIKSSLKKAIDLTRTGSRICVISFHALEDRIVKEIFRAEGDISKAKRNKYSKLECAHNYKLKIITKKPLSPSRDECVGNPRARSAKLRIAERF